MNGMNIDGCGAKSLGIHTLIDDRGAPDALVRGECHDCSHLKLCYCLGGRGVRRSMSCCVPRVVALYENFYFPRELFREPDPAH